MSSPSPFRLPRPQFSLRALLLLMFLVGVGIMIYRWPWEEERELPDGTIATTRYHRGWNGKPLRHGRRVERHASKISNESWFDEGDLRFKRIWYEGAVMAELNYRDGKMHGRYWGQGSHSRASGEYRNGEKHGEWKQESPKVVVREQWQADQLHGPRVWTTPAGRMLQSAEYERGRMVKWNGQPLAEEVQRWLAAAVKDDELRETLLTPVQNTTDDKAYFSHYGEVVYLESRARPLIVYWDTFFPKSELTWNNRPIAEALLEEALENSHTLAFRFNMLQLVPITAESLDWRDRTGVYDVKFAPGSEQEKFWLQPVDASPKHFVHPVARLRGILGDEETGILEVDTTSVKDPDEPARGGNLQGGPPRPRRDQLGQHLNREGFYVEQQGNKLIIKRHAE